MKIGLILAMDIEYRQMRDALGGDTGRFSKKLDYEIDIVFIKRKK